MQPFFRKYSLVYFGFLLLMGGCLSENPNSIVEEAPSTSAPVTVIREPANEPVAQTVPVNVSPSFSFITPLGFQNSVLTNGTLSIQWSQSDPENSLQTSLYYKTTNTGPCSEEATLITSGINESTNSYDWAPSGLVPNTYYLCSITQDGVNPPVENYSGSFVVYPPGACTWVGWVSNAWSQSGNWLGCTVPVAASKVLILKNAPNQPLISSNVAIAGVAESAGGGGTVTVGTGKTLTFNGAGNVLASSIKLQGETPTCTTCLVQTPTWSYFVVNNDATLTLGRGITFAFGYGTDIFIGYGGTAGHLATDAAGAPLNERPAISSANLGDGKTRTLYVQGPSVSSKSSVNIDGLRFLHVSSFYGAISFVSNYKIIQLKNLYMDHEALFARGPFIALGNCASAEILDRDWEGIHFTTNGAINVDVTSATCGNINITATGPGAGPGMERDSGNVLNWIGQGTAKTCIWNGQTTEWANASNWSSCDNGRNGYPDGNDRVLIPWGASVFPEITQNTYIKEFAVSPGAEYHGGGITISNGASLVMTGSYFSSSVTIRGNPTTCTDCNLATIGSWYVNSNAVLTLGKGLTLKTSGVPRVGANGSSGTLATVGGNNASEWPTITQHHLGNPWYLEFEGTASSKAILSIDGLHLKNFKTDKVAMNFYNHYTINSLSNLNIEQTQYAPQVTGIGIRLSNCANATLNPNPMTWSNIIFKTAIAPTGANIDLSAFNCPPGKVVGILVTGSGNGYGVSFARDPASQLTW